MAKTLKLLKELFESFFEKKDYLHVQNLLCEDIHARGFAQGFKVDGIQDAAFLLNNSTFLDFADYEFTIISEEVLSDTLAEISYVAKHKNHQATYNVLAESKIENGTEKLSLINFQLLHPVRGTTIFEGISRKGTNEYRQSLLNETIAGGLLGGYMEKGFPFYFINKRLLEFLGYDSEKSFVEDLDGLILNGIHPDDRKFVSLEVERQLKDGNEYSVDYRMKKQNGEYIWVHDIGRKMVAENGKLAITSVCYDISKEKEHSQLLDKVIQDIDGGIAVYKITKDRRIEIIYASDEVASIGGWTLEEYKKNCSTDAINTVYEDDKKVLWNAIDEAIAHDKVTSVTFRVPNKEGKFVWVHVTISYFGEEDGEPLVREIFTPVSLQNEIQHTLFDTDKVGVCVMDAKTLEVYYSNDASFTIRGLKPINYIGKTCHEIFYECNKTCSECWVENNDDYQSGKIRKMPNGVYVSITSQLKKWNGMDVWFVYSTDITSEMDLRKKILESKKTLDISMKFGKMAFWTYYLDSKKLIQFYSGSAYGYESVVENIPDTFINEKVIHPEDAEKYRLAYQQIQNGEKQSECVVRVFDRNAQEYLWMRIYLILSDVSEDTRCAYGMSVVIDNEIKSLDKLGKAQGEIQKSNERFENLLENVDCGIGIFRCTKDNPFIVDYLSKSLSELSGIPFETMKNEMLENHFLGISAEYHDAVKKTYAYVCETLEPSEVTYKVHFARKDVTWVTLRMRATKEKNGDITIYGVFYDVSNQVESQNALIENQKLTDIACSLANMWCFTLNKKNRVAYMSQRIREDFNVPDIVTHFPESLFKKNTILPEYYKVFRDSFEKIFAGEKSVEFEIQTKFLDSTIHWLRFNCENIQKDGVFTDLIACSAQIIDLEKAISARFEIQHEKATGNEKSLIGYAISNLTKGITVQNKAYILELEYNVIGRGFEKCVNDYLPTIYEEDRNAFEKVHKQEYLLKLFTEGQTSFTSEHRLIRDNGELIWVRNVMNLLSDPKTQEVFLYEYFYNITDSKNYEEIMSAATSTTYTGLASLNLNTGKVIVISRKNNSELNNKPMAEYDYDELIQKHIKDNVVPEEKEGYLKTVCLDAIKEGLKENDTLEFIENFIDSEGKRRAEKSTYFCYDKKERKCIIVKTDVTSVLAKEEKQKNVLENAMIEANRANKAKSEFLSRMSHEIRTPMNAIIGMTAIARDNKSDYLQVADCLQKIDMSSQYLLTLINDILEMSRIESGKIEIENKEFAFDFLTDSIRTIIEPLALRSNVRYEFINKSHNDELYVGDLKRVQQVVINILTNAIKFTKVSGRVRFTVDILSETKDESRFKFEVADTGIGMSPEFMARMFEPFSQEDGSNTSEYGGSGLGLAISKSLIQAMGGIINIESFIGVGTTVTVEIPLKRVILEYETKIIKSNLQTQKKSTALVSLEGKQILMAEDHPLNVMIAKKLLERQGVTVTVAENGQIALDIFTKSEEGFYDAILMDIRMPKMDGLTATKEIRKLKRADARIIPIIAMTANALDSDVKNCKEVGMNEHLAKPFAPEKLYETLKQQIGLRQPADY